MTRFRRSVAFTLALWLCLSATAFAVPVPGSSGLYASTFESAYSKADLSNYSWGGSADGTNAIGKMIRREVGCPRSASGWGQAKVFAGGSEEARFNYEWDYDAGAGNTTPLVDWYNLAGANEPGFLRFMSYGQSSAAGFDLHVWGGGRSGPSGVQQDWMTFFSADAASVSWQYKLTLDGRANYGLIYFDANLGFVGKAGPYALYKKDFWTGEAISPKAYKPAGAVYCAVFFNVWTPGSTGTVADLQIDDWCTVESTQVPAEFSYQEPAKDEYLITEPPSIVFTTKAWDAMSVYLNGSKIRDRTKAPDLTGEYQWTISGESVAQYFRPGSNSLTVYLYRNFNDPDPAESKTKAFWLTDAGVVDPVISWTCPRPGAVYATGALPIQLIGSAIEKPFTARIVWVKPDTTTAEVLITSDAYGFIETQPWTFGTGAHKLEVYVNNVLIGSSQFTVDTTSGGDIGTGVSNIWDSLVRTIQKIVSFVTVKTYAGEAKVNEFTASMSEVGGFIGTLWGKLPDTIKVGAFAAITIMVILKVVKVV